MAGCGEWILYVGFGFDSAVAWVVVYHDGDTDGLFGLEAYWGLAFYWDWDLIVGERALYLRDFDYFFDSGPVGHDN